MRNLLCILALSLFLSSCGNRIKQECTPSLTKDVLKEEEAQVVDTAKMEEACQKTEEVKVQGSLNAPFNNLITLP